MSLFSRIAETWDEKLHPRGAHGRFGDAGRRATARAAVSSGDVNDQAKALVDRVRAGEIPSARVEAAAALGHPIAKAAYPQITPDDLDVDTAAASLGETLPQFVVPVAERVLGVFQPPYSALSNQPHTPGAIETNARATLAAAQQYASGGAPESLAAAKASGVATLNAIRAARDSSATWEAGAGQAVLAASTALLGTSLQYFNNAKLAAWTKNPEDAEDDEPNLAATMMELLFRARSAHTDLAVATADTDYDWDDGNYQSERAKRLRWAQDEAREAALEAENGAQKTDLAAALLPTIRIESTSLHGRVVEASDWDKKLKEQKCQAESECDGRQTNKPWLTPSGPKKRAVCVQDGGKAKIVRFGDKSLEIKRDDPGRRKNFRARHGCDDPGPKTKARYWSCKYWSPGKTASQLDLGETTDLPTAYGITRPMTGRTGLGSSPDSPALQRFGRRPLRVSVKKLGAVG